MPVLLKKDEWRVKDPLSGNYTGAAILSTTLPEDAAQIVENTQIALNSEELRAEQIINNTQNAVNGINSQSDIMLESISKAIHNGTDTTLEIEGMPADAKATGNLKKKLMKLPTENDYGENGQYPRSTGNGIEWVDYGLPSDEQTAEAIQSWLNAHPEATTTVQDNSLTELKFTNNLKLKTIKDYVTPEMFGAIGDGEYDDTNSINSAIENAINNNYTVIFTQGKVYRITEPIVIENPPKNIIMYGELSYKGSGTALTIGNLNSSTDGINLELNVIGDTSEIYVPGSIGVKLINIINSTIYFKKIMRFETGAEIIGSGRAFSYNNIQINTFISNLISLKLNSRNDGWVNENKFYNGRFAVYSTDSFKDSTVGILITSENDYYNNANIFYSPCLEGLNTCVKIEYGKFNKFYDCRTERATIPFYALNTSCRNYMSVSYGVTLSPYNFNMSNRLDGNNDIISNGFNNIVFDSGDILANCASNETETSFAQLITKNYNNIQSNIAINYAEISENGLIIKKSGMVGALIDTIKNKTFLVCPIANSKHRIGVVMYDLNNNIINDEPPRYYPLTTSSTSVMSFLSGKIDGFITGSDTNVDFIINIPDKCVKAIFFILGVNDCLLKRFIIKAHFMEYAYTIDNFNSAVLSNKPTSIGRIGQIVKKSSPSLGEIGWVYTGTDWVIFG